MAKKKRSNKLIWALLIIALLGMALAYFGKQQGWWGKEELTKITAEEVKRRRIIETVSANGKIYPESEVIITPDVSGEIMRIKVAEGDSVKKGQLLAQIDPRLYETGVTRAEAAYNSAKSNEINSGTRIQQSDARITQLQVQIDNTQKNYDRQLQLFNDGIVSRAEVDNAEAAIKGLKADMLALAADKQSASTSVQGAGFSIESAAATLKEARESLRRTNIYAPMNGVISSINVEKGERVVGTSQFAGTEMMRISNLSNMEVKVDVSENDILRVSLQDTAVVEIDAYGEDRKFKGVVTQIANSSGVQSPLTSDQVANFEVKVRLVASSYKDLYKKHRFPFRPGMSATVDIQTQVADNILTVPIQSVTAREIPDSLRTGNSSDDEAQELVFIYQNGAVQSQKVSTGIQDNKYIEVLNGLEEGTQVVTAPFRVISRELEDSMEVKKVSKKDLYAKDKKK